MDHNAKYWKCEYENLRRKKNKQIEKMKLQQVQVIKRTLETLEIMGVNREEFIQIYANRRI